MEFHLEGHNRITNIDQWRELITANWIDLLKLVKEYSFDDNFQRFLALILIPLKPNTNKQVNMLADFLDSNGLIGGRQLRSYTRQNNVKSLTVEALVTEIFTDDLLDSHTMELRTVLFSNTALASAKPEQLFDIIINLCSANSSNMNIKIGTIESNEDVIVAQNVYNNKNNDHKDALAAYLDNLRVRWNHVDFSNILPDPIHHFQTHLHELYTRLDVWAIPPSEDQDDKQKAIHNDFTHERQSIVKSINDSAHHVIVGGPGTGKSTVCGFIATGLAYSCDPEAQKKEGINGLRLLGPEWQHGPMLPVYVRLRHFASSKKHFPSSLTKANAQCLLAYLRQHNPEFARYFTKYFKNQVERINGAILILDGLDEIFDRNHREIAKKIIEHFCGTFRQTRILVTCRSAVYRPNYKWYLSEQFSVAEIAPFTRVQIKQYVSNWYNVAKENRPNRLGGIEFAAKNAKRLSLSLSKTLLSNDNLLSLSRQPLLLTLLVLIHEQNEQLPENRATLYENTVKLLNKWNPPDDEDPLATKLRNLNYAKVRKALQHIAFNFQRDDIYYRNNEARIQQKDLIAQLLTINSTDDKLGAALEDVLEYLATRNGILVVDQNTSYRFLHLSIREYLASCALIEQYDEINMPARLKPTGHEWSFPDNICQLLSDDPYRWREVALFCGAILGTDMGQDRLWVLIETLLPDYKTDLTKNVNEQDLYRIEIAGEIWSTNAMRTRMGSHSTILKHLQDTLSAIINDERLDVPERVVIQNILKRIKSDSA